MIIRIAPPPPAAAKRIPPPPLADDASVDDPETIQGGILDLQTPNEQVATAVPEAVKPALQVKLNLPPLAVFAPPMEELKAPSELKFSVQGLAEHAPADKV